METVNSKQVQQVFQRMYTAKPQAEPDSLNRLIDQEWESAAFLLTLARRAGGKFSPQLRQLANHSRSRWACLQGLARLHTGKPPRHTHPRSPSGSPGELLRQCCRDAAQRVREYEDCAGACGPVAQLLAREQTADCRTLLEILGNWEA